MARVYDLRAWHRVRREHLVIEPLCRMCNARGLTMAAQHVDHITPISQGGAWFEHENLQSLCVSCHSHKTHADYGGTLRLGCTVDGLPVDGTHHWNGEG